MEQQGFTLWFTGLSGSGKTTLAKLVEMKLRARGLKVERLDGDIVRQSLSRDLGFTKEDRDKNIERVAFVAKLLTRNGVAVLTSFISPYRDVRARSREEIGNFVEVYCKAPLEVLIERDVKGLYTKALRGEIENFTGISDTYEEPLHPEVICETGKESPEESAAKIIAKLEELGYIPEVASEKGVYPDRTYSEEEEEVIEERLRALGYI
ncbi:MAG: adenylyl-sulfate kinase [Anaerolineae bacterium]